MIKFHCPHCNQKLGVPDEYAGRRVRCSKCQQPSVVPHLEPPPAEIIDPLPIEPTEPEGQEELSLQPQEESESPYEDEIARNAAIAAAGRSRSRPGATAAFSRPARTSAESGQAGGSGAGKIPLSLGLSLLAMAGCIILWVGIAKLSGFEIGFLVLLVPLAGAWGLTVMTDRRNVGLGILAIFLGFFGMMAGKVCLARFVVYPMLQEEMQNDDSELSKAFKEGAEQGFESAYTLSREEVSTLIHDDETMVYIAAIDLSAEGHWEMQTVKAMFMMDEETPADQVDPVIQNAFERSYERLEGWSDPVREEKLRKHHPQYSSMVAEAFGQMMMEGGLGKAILGVTAFIATFGLLDLLWFPMGLYGAYKIGAGKE